MKKRFGKIIAVPFTTIKPVEGLHVYWTGCPSKVKSWIIRSLKYDTVTLSPDINSPRGQTAKINELRNLMVLDLHTGNHIQLGFIDWKKVIKNKLIDNDITIQFTIHTIEYSKSIKFKEAVIESDMEEHQNTASFYTEKDMLLAFEAGEYRNEYQATAPDFNHFISVLKDIKQAANALS